MGTAAPAAPALFRAARLAIVASALLAPAIHAVLAPSSPVLPWLTAAALAVGTIAGHRAPGIALAALLAVAPLWQVLVGALIGDPDIQLVMPWLAAVAGCLAMARPSRWRAVDTPWLLPIAGWALVLAVVWPVTVAREFDFSRYALSGLSANGAGTGSARFVASSVILAAEAQLVALLLFDWMFGASDGERRRLWRWCAPAVAVVCALAVWQSTVAPSFLNRAPWIALGRAGGGFYDGNATGALAALFGPLLAAGIAHRATSPGAVAALLWSMGSLAAVLASGSRTSLAAWALASVTAWVWAARRRPRVVLAAVAGTLAVIGLVGWLPPTAVEGQFSAAARLTATLRAVGAGGIDPLIDVLWRRDGYGPAAMAMIAEHPWVGVGPGAFGVVLPDYARMTVGILLAPDNAQNWWRHQAAELGLLGALPAFAASLLLFAAVIRAAWRGSARVWALPVLGLGVMSCVSPPVQHPLLQVLVALLLASCVIGLGVPLGRDTALTGPVAAGSLWLVAASCAIGLAIEGHHTFRPAYRAARFGFEYHYGFGPEFTTPTGPARWAARRAVAVMRPAGFRIAVDVSLPHTDLDRAPVTVTLSNRHGALCQWQVTDAAVRSCYFLEPLGEEWQVVQLTVSRPWDQMDGRERAALVSARLAP